MPDETIPVRAGRYAAWFGPRLKELRGKAGLSQAALAERAGVSQSRIAEYESATTRYRPTWETVIRCSLALEVDPAVFLREPTGGPKEKI